MLREAFDATRGGTELAWISNTPYQPEKRVHSFLSRRRGRVGEVGCQPLSEMLSGLRNGGDQPIDEGG